MEELDRLNIELSEAYATMCLLKARLDIAIEGLSNIEDSCDTHGIAKKCLDEIKYLSSK